MEDRAVNISLKSVTLGKKRLGDCGRKLGRSQMQTGVAAREELKVKKGKKKEEERVWFHLTGTFG